MTVKIWIDADACPKPVKDIIMKASDRTQTPVILVANQVMRIPLGKNVTAVVVSRDFDAADNYIVLNLDQTDIVVTADVPLADLVVQRGATALNPRGEIYTEANIKDRLSMRNLMTELRGGGIIGGGPKSFGTAEVNSFANAFDRTLTAKLKENS